MMNNSQSFGNKLRELRETQGLLLRQVAATLEVDTAFLSKVERDEKQLRQEHIIKLAALFGVKEDDLHTHWLSDKILDLVKNETTAEQSLKLTLKRLKN
jgi:transcriptional regulator with XRE-family HTH domain